MKPGLNLLKYWVLLMAINNLSAAVRYVDANGASPLPPFTNWATAARVIQDAVDAAVPGDEIVVTNGVYRSGTVSATGLNRVALTNKVIVRSVNGPALTFIEGLADGVRCAYIGDDSVLSGFTLTNGAAVGDGPPSWGGGVFSESSGVVTNCVLTGNWAGHGGGAYGGTLDHCTLTGNSAGEFGGGAAGSLLDNCVIVGNTAIVGGGVYAQFGARLNNCTVVSNSAAEWGGGVCVDWGSGECSLYNSIVYFNTAPDRANYDALTELNYCCTTPLPEPGQGLGNITDAPLFIDAPGGNYRLRSDSPCINVGGNAYAPGPTDLDGRPRIANGTVDIGAYEFPAPAPGSWTGKANMPLARGGAGAGVVDGILYLVGGDEQVGVRQYQQTKTLFAYDPNTDSWTQKSDMPTARRFPAVAVLDGIIYVIGGGGINDPATDAVEVYDPKTDQWTIKTRLPAPRSLVAACAANGVIYAIGGIRGVVGGVEVVSTVAAYDPKTDQWTPRKSLPTPTASFGAYLVNGFIYFFCEKYTFVYDPNTDRWSAKSRIPSWSLEGEFHATGTADGILYLFGGEDSVNKGTKFALAYDPVKDRFHGKRVIPAPVEAAACATINGRIYLAGGADKSPVVYSDAVIYDTLWMFDPQGGVAPRLLSLTRESPTSVRLRWQGEKGMRYGVESRTNAASGWWTRAPFSSGANTVLATNAVVEANCAVSPADPQKFFRVVEAN